MLTQLSIRNFAIIQAIDLDFRQGVTVFTGETGAGKSILMEALAVVLGARASGEYIRTGADSFVVSAEFDIQNRPDITMFLEEQNILTNDQDNATLLISRRLDASGRGRILVNGTVMPLRMLAKLGEMLVDIHGQNDHRLLLSKAYQLSLLDSASSELTDISQQYRDVYAHWKLQENAYRDLLAQIASQQSRKEDLLAQIAEIDAAQLTSNEEEDDLQAQLARMTNKEKIVTHVETSLSLLSGRDCVQEMLSRSIAELDRATAYDGHLVRLSEVLDTALISVEDTIRELQDYMYTMQFSPDELHRLQNRAQEIRALERKYGATIADVLSFLSQARAEADVITSMDEMRQGKEQELSDAKERAQALRASLNQRRKQEADQLCNQIADILQELDLEHARLQFFLEEGTELTPSGLAQAELYFAPNPGEDLRPLKDIASGGEMSRLALAIKAISPGASRESTWVLDEVDTGISGNAAIRVGKLIRRIGQRVQVLCITHMPQTAAVADWHIHLSKHIADGRTSTTAEELDRSSHIQEIARMLEGDDYSSTAQETAVRLITQMT